MRLPLLLRIFGIALLLAPVLTVLLPCRILWRGRGLGIGQALPFSAGRGLPGSGAIARLFEPRGEVGQILAKVTGQAAIGCSDGYENVAAAFGKANLDALVSLTCDLQLDIVCRHRGRRRDGYVFLGRCCIFSWRGLCRRS